ncbi:MAG: methylornithine synthase PylB [Candidatus Methanomethylicus sp.]|nr:methylornithine synthase PylB [Candidatus Methanomethylicus sp.]
MVKINLEIRDEKVVGILGAALDGRSPSIGELRYLAKAQGADVNFAMFQVARNLTERNFGKKMFLYGFVYFSTYCRNVCTFCYYRKVNANPPRYRKSVDEVLKAVGILEKYGIHLADLTMGEDPQICEVEHYEPILKMCRQIKKEYDLPVMISPGVVPRSVLTELGSIGVDWYALYQETHNRNLYARMRVGQPYEVRAEARAGALKEGILVEDGILLGIGETVDDVVDSVYEMKTLGAQQVRAMGLEPQVGTPLEGRSSPPILDEMRAIAMMRLVHQDRLIPASYDVDGLKGLELRIMAGANVVTSIIPPELGLHGVAQASLDIDSSQRTVEGITPYLKRLGLEPNTRLAYKAWLGKEKARLQRN